MIKALQDKGLFQSLAEPNLIAEERQGSELPRRRRVSLSDRAAAAAATRVTIMFKEFGVRLNFTPTVLGGDLINLKVRPR